MGKLLEVSYEVKNTPSAGAAGVGPCRRGWRWSEDDLQTDCNTPTYCDLGKAAKDVFNKAYGFCMVKIDLRTKSWRGIFYFWSCLHWYRESIRQPRDQIQDL